MDKNDAKALELVEKTVCLFEQIAAAIKDDSLRVYAVRGTGLLTDTAPAMTMLDAVRTTAHIVNVRLTRLRNERRLTPQQEGRAIEFQQQLDRYIRKALVTLKPDQYAFCADDDDDQ